MDKSRFDQTFEAVVAQPLSAIGFSARGKSLIFADDINTLALIRLGGRMAATGCAAHVLCFRHSFLRDRSETVPKSAPLEPFDYPFKFDPSDAPPWNYSAQNLRYPYGVVRWSFMDERELDRWAAALAAKIIDDFVPWARSMTPRVAKEQLHTRGENAWCERLWIEDYNQIPSDNV